jgi:hypothetical protein
MNSRTIEVVISPKGEVTVQTKGYSGSDCLHASKMLEEALGVKTKEAKTADFYQAAVNEQHVQQ